MRSAIYEGELMHLRSTPEHSFRKRIAVPLLDLHEIDAVTAAHPLWSNERRNVVSFRRRDYLGDPRQPLDEAVRDAVEHQSGHRPAGPISLLAQVRSWGWLFNPIAVYYCYDSTGSTVEHALVQVTNTPWHEQHPYVLSGPGSHELDKAMHVSPFFGMDHSYRITYGAPGDDLALTIALLGDDVPVFVARQRLCRREISRASLGRFLWRYPLLTARISAGIHVNALRLWRKGATFHRHPAKCPTKEVSDARTTSRSRSVVQDA